ncbi:hypothetical protein ACLOJK_002385 [Asimina triloba]
MVTADKTIMPIEGLEDETPVSPAKNSEEKENQSSNEVHKCDGSLENIHMVTADDTIIPTHKQQNDETVEDPVKVPEDSESISFDIDKQRDESDDHLKLEDSGRTSISSTLELQNNRTLECLENGAEELESHSSKTDDRGARSEVNIKTSTEEQTFIEGQNYGTPKSRNAEKLADHSFDTNHKMDGSLGIIQNGNGVHDVITCYTENHDLLFQMAVELTFQNEYLKAQFQGLKNQPVGSIESSKQENETVQEDDASENVKELQEKILSLNKEIQERKETQTAAEDAMRHLQMSYFEADARAQELSAKLSQG